MVATTKYAVGMGTKGIQIHTINQTSILGAGTEQVNDAISVQEIPSMHLGV